MKIEIPEHKKLVHESMVPIRWGDMDAMGHVNNAVYFRYMEVARIAWFSSIGHQPRRDVDGLILVNAFCNFIRQMEYPGEMLIRTFVTAPSRSSFDTWTTIERTDQPGVLAATGGATAVWFESRSGKSAPLPERLRQLLLD